jgi:acetyltransferase-like isoleucine patch superfamily enzyme
MNVPLSRPPIGRHTAEREVRPQSAEAASPRAGLLGRFLEEAREGLDFTDLRRLAWPAIQVLPDFTFPRTRARLLSALGCDVRPGVAIYGYLHIVGPRDAAKNLRIGPGTTIGPQVTLCLDAPITLGRKVSIGPHAVLYTATHDLGFEDCRMGRDTIARPIVVEDGAWICLAATILPGVRIGRGAVVAAGAVVNKDVPENVLVSGNPATVVEKLPERRE